MDVLGKRVRGEVEDPLVVDELVAKRLCVGASTSAIEYCLPTVAPTSLGQVIVSEIGSATQWGTIPGVSNALQRVTLYESRLLDDAGWISPQDDHLGQGINLLNNHWTMFTFETTTADERRRWGICSDSPDPAQSLTIRCLKFFQVPALGAIPAGYPIALGGWSNLNVNWSWQLWRWIDTSAVDLELLSGDGLQLEFWLANGSMPGGANGEQYVNVYLSTDDEVDPVWDREYIMDAPSRKLVGVLNRATGDETMQNFKLSITGDMAKTLCEAPRVRLVFEAYLSPRTDGNSWRNSAAGFAIRDVIMYGTRVGTGTTVGIPEDQIDHTVIQNVGINTHAQIDAKLATLQPPSATDHTSLLNVGTNTHAQIDSKILLVDQDVTMGADPVFTSIATTDLAAFDGSDISANMQNGEFSLSTAGQRVFFANSGGISFGAGSLFPSNSLMDMRVGSVRITRAGELAFAAQPAGTTLFSPTGQAALVLTDSAITADAPVVIDSSASLATAALALNADGDDAEISIQDQGALRWRLKSTPTIPNNLELTSAAGTPHLRVAQTPVHNTVVVLDENGASLSDELGAEGVLVASDRVTVREPLRAEKGIDIRSAGVGRVLSVLDGDDTVVLEDGRTMQLGSTSDVTATKCTSILLEANATINPFHLVTIVNGPANVGRLEHVPSSPLEDDAIVVGASMTGGIAGDDIVVCIGGIATLSVQTNVVITAGQALEKSDNEAGRIISSNQSPGTFGIALTGGTGVADGSVTVRALFVRNELF